MLSKERIKAHDAYMESHLELGKAMQVDSYEKPGASTQAQMAAWSKEIDTYRTTVPWESCEPNWATKHTPLTTWSMPSRGVALSRR